MRLISGKINEYKIMEGERTRTPEDNQKEFNKLPEKAQKILREKAHDEALYEEAMIAKTKRTREASDIVTLNLSEQEIDELDVPENERDEKFFKTVKKVWPRINKFAVHTNNENITPLYKGSDLDGETCIKILEKTRKKIIRAGDNQNIWFVKKGESMDGAYNFDTGNVGGTRVKADKKTGTVTIHSDHHDSEIRNDTCAAKLMYEDLTYLRVLEKDKKFEKYLDFVTQIDNRTFPLDKEKLKDCHKTLFGLAEFVKPNEIIKFFKEGRDPAEPLTDEQINKLDPHAGKRMKDGEPIQGKDLIDRSRNLEKNVKKSVERLEQMKEDGLIIDAPGYGGKIVVDIARNGTKTIPCGFDAVRAYGYKAYVSWNPDKKSFFINTVDDLKPGHQFEQEGILDMRGRHMLMKPEKNTQPLTITLEKILSTLTDGNFEAQGELKEYLDKEKESQEKIEQPKSEVPEVPKKEQIDKERQEAERLAKEKAWEILSDTRVMDNKLEKVAKAFKEATGKDLIEEREKIVKEHLRGKGKKIIKAEDVEKYRQWIIRRNIRKEGEKILQDNNSKALDILGRIDPDIKKEDREKYLSNLKNKLGLKNVRGGNVVLDKLINDGYKIEKGWFGGRKMYKMENGKKSFFDAKKDFGKKFQEIKSEITRKVENLVKSKIEEGIRMLREERYYCARNLILEAEQDHSLEVYQKEVERKNQIDRQKQIEEQAETNSVLQALLELKNQNQKVWIKRTNGAWQKAEIAEIRDDLQVKVIYGEKEPNLRPYEFVSGIGLLKCQKERKAIEEYNLEKQRIQEAEQQKEIERREQLKKQKKETDKTESSEKPESFEDWIREADELVERFKEVPPSRKNLFEFKEERDKLSEKFVRPKNKDEDKKFRKWKKDVLETIRRLEKSGKSEIKPSEQDETVNTSEPVEIEEKIVNEESIEPAKEVPVEQKSSKESFTEKELVDEYVPLRKKYLRARGEAKKKLEKQMAELEKRIKEAKLRERQNETVDASEPEKIQDEVASKKDIEPVKKEPAEPKSSEELRSELLKLTKESRRLIKEARKNSGQNKAEANDKFSKAKEIDEQRVELKERIKEAELKEKQKNPRTRAKK